MWPATPPPKKKSCSWGLKTQITQRLFSIQEKFWMRQSPQGSSKKNTERGKFLESFLKFWFQKHMWEKYLPSDCYFEHLLEIFPTSCLLSVWRLPGRKHVEDLCELSPREKEHVCERSIRKKNGKYFPMTFLGEIFLGISRKFGGDYLREICPRFLQKKSGY